ncbi:MAG: bifunctional phosphoribosylaminoimidazolecarboxamide formyltransferase/IMP cyclohydrolase [Elusimicrobiota bacterium]|jgi:phosphoribosylaminoimidazolecarboxamide formyltransferase/IMP cyclohydrolase
MSAKKTALLSVSDKTGIVEFAIGLSELGWDILSSGSTAQVLRQAELSFRDVSELTGAAAGTSTELLAGRVRLLQPKLFAGILADLTDARHAKDLEREDIPSIDLVAANLYPLSEVLSGNPSGADVLDFLDVAGSALLRAAARNYPRVLALCDPKDYPAILEALRQGSVSKERRQALGSKAFHYVAYYDSTVAQYLGSGFEHLPEELVMGLKKAVDLPYGENPHQRAALYRLSGARPWGLNAAAVVHGRPLNFNHYLGMDLACELAGEFREPACVMVRHTNPAGAAVADRPAEAARLAYRSDPAGCTGAIAAFNRPVDEETAKALAPENLECIAAPEFSAPALDILRKKKDLRLVCVPSLLLFPEEIDIKAVSGGLLVQEKDHPTVSPERRIASKRKPTDLESAALEFAWRVAKHTLTHAAVLARGMVTLGIAGGQTARRDAVRLALSKSQERHPIVSPALPLALASDGPLGPAHIREAASSGVSAVIEPGGSPEDAEAVRLCDELHLCLVFTGMRHYRH